MKKIKLTTKQKEFLKELRDLLLKYNAEIYWTCDECSDIYGLVDDRLVVDMVGQENDIDLSIGCIDKYNIEYILNGDVEDEEDE